MPVYVQAALLAGASPERRLTMCVQGKSCFNFAPVDPALLNELAALTQAAYASYQARGFVP
jgi:hypothetical protein